MNPRINLKQEIIWWATDMPFLLPAPWIDSIIETCDTVIVKVAVKLPDDDPLVLALEKGPCIAYKEERRWRLAQGKLFDY